MLNRVTPHLSVLEGETSNFIERIEPLSLIEAPCSLWARSSLEPSTKTLDQLGTRPPQSTGCPLRQLRCTAALAKLLQPVQGSHCL